MLGGGDDAVDFVHDGAHIARHSHRDGVDAPDFFGVNLNVDDAGVRRDKAVVVKGGGLPQPGAGGDDDIGAAHGVNGLRRAQPTQMPQVVGVVVRHGVGAAIRGYDGGAGEIRQTGDFRIGQAPFHAAAGDDDRALGG